MHRPTIAFAVLIAFAWDGACAQSARGWSTTGTSRPAGKTGVQATPPQRAVPAPSPFGAPAPTVVALKLVPAVIMSDGSVFADFGFGLERVRRACVGGVGGLGDTRDRKSVV